MAFILRISLGRGETFAAASAAPEAALLRICNDGRELFEHAAPGIRLAVDPVAHDCCVLRRRRAGEREILAVCFGWCGLLDQENARLDERTLDAVVADLRADPRHPARAAARLTGNFVLVIHDPETSRAFVLSDEWAVRSFHYGGNEREVVVSSRAAAVASLLQAPIDGMAWTAGLRGAFPAVHGTMFQGVRRAWAGQAIVADLAAGSVRLACDDRFFDHHVSRSFDESAQALAEAVRRSARRCAGLAPEFVDLTGGNDSRLAAAGLHAEGLASSAVFQVGENAGDADGPLAREIASRLGARILLRNRDGEKDVPVDFFASCSVRFDGYFMSLGNARRMWADRRDYGDYRYHWGSLGGELARDYFWRHEYLKFWSPRQVDMPYLLKRRLYARWNDRFAAAAGLAVPETAHDDYLLAPLRKIARHMDGASKFYVLDLLYVVRLTQKTAVTWAYAPDQTVVLPFLAKEFLDAALGAAWWQRANRRLSLDVLARLAPGLQDIPNDYGMVMAPLAWSTLGAHVKSLAGDVLRRRILNRGKSRPASVPPRVLPGDFAPRARELEQNGVLPPEAARLVRWLEQEGTEAERLRAIPAMVGLGEVLNAYPAIRREMSFEVDDGSFLSDVEWPPSRTG